jgi:hypothetical protein
MPIPVTCPQCGLVLAAPESAAGKMAKCRNCQTVLTIPTPGLEILDPPTPPVAVAVAAYEPAPAPPSFVPTGNSFGFDEPAAKPRKLSRYEDDDEDDDDRPRRKHRRDEDDDEDDRPRGRKAAPKEKKDKTLMYVIVAACTVLFIVGVGGFGVWYAVIRKPPVETVDTSILAKPKPTVGVVKAKPTFKAAPKDWEYVDDVDFQALVPITGKGFDLEKEDGTLSKAKQEEFPELGEVRNVGKEFAREVRGEVFVFSLRQESLKQVNKDPKRAVSTWSDIFLIKFPPAEVKVTDFTNAEFKYSGRQYYHLHESGAKLFFRMFVAHDKFYVLMVVGADLTERNDYVKNFFDNFQPMK